MANFILSGKHPVSIEWLISAVNGIAILVMLAFRIDIGIRSYPKLFLFLNDATIFIISLGLVCSSTKEFGKLPGRNEV